jgi:protein phosphatase
MGGANAGEIASGIAADVFSRTLLAGGYPPEELMRIGLEQANREIYSHSWEHPECRGMGTTLVAVLIMDEVSYILNVGDSRAYTIRGEKIRQITQDHSLVEELVRSGNITREEARVHPYRNIITRALGTERSVTGDLYIHRLHPGEQLLLCSDGLCNELSEEELRSLVADTQPVEESCQRLVAAALEHGARDNVTAVILDLQDSMKQ